MDHHDAPNATPIRETGAYDLLLQQDAELASPMDHPGSQTAGWAYDEALDAC